MAGPRATARSTRLSRPSWREGFAYLKLKVILDCPKFGYEPCSPLFTRYRKEGGGFLGGNVSVAHGWFDAHHAHFSHGIKRLLAARVTVQRFGMGLLLPGSAGLPSSASERRGALAVPPDSRSPRDRESGISPRPNLTRWSAATWGEGRVVTEPTAHEFDVALSLARSERKTAGQIAGWTRQAGFSVFYKACYDEQLWGKDSSTKCTERSWTAPQIANN